MREIVLDTETTGLDPESGTALVEIGCLEADPRHLRRGRVWSQYVNPERDMPDEAFRVHGLSAEFLSDQAAVRSMAREFLEFIERCRLVIHNAGFDVSSSTPS